MENRIRNNSQQDENIDVKIIISKVFEYWYLFAISLLICVFAAYLYNKVSVPIYRVKTTVLIKKDTKPNIGGGSSEDLINGFGLFSSQKNIENEIGILQSYALTRKAIEKLNLKVSYFDNTLFYSREMYANQPFKVVFDTNQPQLISVPFHIRILSRNTFVLEANEKKCDIYSYSTNKVFSKLPNLRINKEYKFGDIVQGIGYCFKVVLDNQNFNELCLDSKYSFSFNDIDNLAVSYMNLFTIAAINKQADIIQIYADGSNVDKLISILNKLTDEYIYQNLQEKNQIAVNTINFIDEQLSEISDSLRQTEDKLQTFRTTNNVMDVDVQAKSGLDLLQDLDGEKAILLVKSKYNDYLKDYLFKSKSLTDIVAPSSLGIEDPMINNLVLELSKLSVSRNSMLVGAKTINPAITSIDAQINSVKSILIENINNSIKTNNIALTSLNTRISSIETEINKLPKTERQLVRIQRNFKINDAIYTFLLQKRSEAAIAKASNLPDNRVIDYARLESLTPISPKKGMAMMIGILLGLLLPSLYIFLRSFLLNRVESRSEIEKITGIPIIGNIPHTDSKSKTIVYDNPKSVIAESFRGLRTNIQFLSIEKLQKVIAVTSSIPGEGKTFVSSNLATTIAFSGKRVVVIGMDMRKPRIHENFDLNNSTGLSTYLIGNSAIEDIIFHSRIENLDLIPAGPIPPNPAELIETKKMLQMIQELSEQYDHVILDTPPLTLVADALLISRFCDSVLYVVRMKYTNKAALAQISDIYSTRKIENLGIVVNDIKSKGIGYGYGYGYGYEYGYGYGYGEYVEGTEDKEFKKK